MNKEERIPDVPGDAGYDPNEFKALATVLYKLPDCKECGTSPYCNDTCYEKTRVEDAEAQAIATEAATRFRVVEAIRNVENPWTVTLYDALRHEGFESARQSILKEVGGLKWTD